MMMYVQFSISSLKTEDRSTSSMIHVAIESSFVQSYVKIYRAVLGKVITSMGAPEGVFVW